MSVLYAVTTAIKLDGRYQIYGRGQSPFLAYLPQKPDRNQGYRRWSCERDCHYSSGQVRSIEADNFVSSRYDNSSLLIIADNLAMQGLHQLLLL